MKCMRSTRSCPTPLPLPSATRGGMGIGWSPSGPRRCALWRRGFVPSVAPGIISEAGWHGWTRIFLYPGVDFQVVDALVTNFHVPRSTLLMLVSAFAGSGVVREAYATAIAARYRFYSFGDACFFR
ncbi:MAG: hypothetical protein EBV45_14620 [Chloroflexi bacterium]|nr:hypothetical protein [Chloroflexota bacterium]